MSRKLIFVVDDDSLSRDFLTEAIRSMGHEVQSFENGSLALQATDRKVPDMVLSDVRMPVVDGIQLTRALQDRFPRLARGVGHRPRSDRHRHRSLALGCYRFPAEALLA